MVDLNSKLKKIRTYSLNQDDIKEIVGKYIKDNCSEDIDQVIIDIKFNKEPSFDIGHEGLSVSMVARENQRPVNCRNRLQDEGKAHPKSGCDVSGCSGVFGNNKKLCEAK